MKEKIMRKKALLLLIFLLIISTKYTFAQWIQTNGPSGHGGAVYSICFQDSNIFIGAESIYFSKNNGGSWLKLRKPNDLL
jgi:hypothetical protein